MESPNELTSGFIPFPDTYISSNFASSGDDSGEPAVASSCKVVPQARQSTAADGDGIDGDEGDLPPKKRRRMIFLCDACGTFYTEKRALARHRHTDTHRLNTGLPLAAKYPCKVCAKEFSRDHDRQRHENEKHHGKKRLPKTKRDPSVMSFLSEDTGRRDSVTTMSVILDRDEEKTLSTIMLGAEESEPLSQKEEGERPITVRRSSDEGYEQSWFAEQSDEETAGPTDHTPDSYESLQTVDSAVDMSEEPHESKFPTITTHDYRERIEDHKLPTLQESTDNLQPSMSARPASSYRPRATVIQRRGKLKSIPPNKPKLCAFCHKAFEEDQNDLLAHLREHFKALTGELLCEVCKIGFVHKADLDSHQFKANVMGHCGFSFEHQQPCTGHHPPSRTQLGTELTDRDAVQMGAQLRHWEHSQLRAYMQEIKDLIASRPSRASSCHTIEALTRRSKESLSSFALSVNTYHSAPCDVPSSGKTDVHGLQQRLRMMSLKESTSQVRQKAKKIPHIVRSGSLNRALFNAAKNAELSQINLLMKLGAQPDAVVDSDSILSIAAQWANTDTVKLLIESGAGVSAMNGKYGTALNGAAFAGQSGVVRFLITQGANVCQPGGKYGCALSTAAASGALEVMKILLDSGANIHQYGGSYGLPLNTAAACNRFDAARYLLSHGADIDRCAGSEGSALGYAVWNSHTAMVKQLLDSGAHPDGGLSAGKHGRPLHVSILRLAGKGGKLEIVKALLASGADVNAQGQVHGSALCTATLHADIPDMVEVVKLLLRHGADVHVSGQRGTAFQLAKKCRDTWLEKMPFFAQDREEAMEEVLGGCYEVIRLLREAGAGDGERKSSSSSWRKSEESLGRKTGRSTPGFAR